MISFITLLGLTLLSLVAAETATDNHKLHEQMTTEELKQIFNAELHEVPDYDVVPIHWPRLHKRSYGSNTRIRLNAFGRNIKLWLNPVEGILVEKNTPVYYARSTEGPAPSVSFSKIIDAMAIVDQLFEDREKKASLVVKRSKSGTNLISGHIGSEGWNVKPVPERFRHQLNAKYRRSTDKLGNFTVAGDYEPEHHLIFKISDVSDEDDYITQPIEDDILNNVASRSKRSSPDAIYPQIMVLVDYATFKLYGEYIYDLLEYLVPFWNGVDLRFRSLESPRVRLNIAGIIVAKDDAAFAFMSKNKVNSKMINIYGALDSLSLYMPAIKSYFPLDSYDIAVAMAPYSMCSPTEEGFCKPGTLGLAYVSGACRNDLNTIIPQSLSVTVIQDKGGFDGMHTVAHELGHLFGATHDGQEGSVCSAEVGHIMSSTPVLTEQTADWSPCTTDDFNKFFNVDDPICLFDKPKTKTQLPRLLPGRLMSADEQCAKIEGTKFCPAKVNLCIRLRCVDKTGKWCREVGDAAADGTTCAKDKICIHGKCLAEKDLF